MMTIVKISSFAILPFLFIATVANQANFAGEQQTQDIVPKRDERAAKNERAALYMQAKLSNSQQVLRGLVTEDFDDIASGAKQLKKIAEAAHWPTTVDEVYQHYSFEFRRQCDKLVQQAERKDLRAAHFTYLHMSTTCIDCHDYVRPRFRVERKPQGPVRLIPTEWDGPSKQLRPRPQPDDQDSDTST